jgi:hypothetical protein
LSRIERPANRIFHFISGHLDLTETEFQLYYRADIDTILENYPDEGFVIGDARGADMLAQQYLWGKTDRVFVYHMLAQPRFNAGFETIGGFKTDLERDTAMTKASDFDLAWVRPGREKSGTQRNIDRRKMATSSPDGC